MEKTPKKNAGKKASEPVTKCDHPNEVVAARDTVLISKFLRRKMEHFDII